MRTMKANWKEIRDQTAQANQIRPISRHKNFGNSSIFIKIMTLLTMN
jgi:hypothetical protein